MGAGDRPAGWLGHLAVGVFEGVGVCFQDQRHEVPFEGLIQRLDLEALLEKCHSRFGDSSLDGHHRKSLGGVAGTDLFRDVGDRLAWAGRGGAWLFGAGHDGIFEKSRTFALFFNFLNEYWRMGHGVPDQVDSFPH